jgi:aryl-alcohol dehydrogenase-like predicted oxidoreductase
MINTPLRCIGQTNLRVSPVALGCWPISGMSSLDVSHEASLATIDAAIDSGINFLDTAYCYGAQGESERLIASVVGARRSEVAIATKGGIHFDAQLRRHLDARPAMLLAECDESLRRLNTDRVELYYLHAPDPNVPVAESAAAIGRMIEAGKVLSAGASNCTVAQLEEFHAVCPLSAVQPPYNMLQRDIEDDLVPWCVERNISIMVYWPLLKGLLAGKLARDHVFPPKDGRSKYPMFQGEEWQKNQDFVDELRAVAADVGRTVTQVVVNWTIHRPGITAALCGAKRPEQIRESAGAMGWQLDEHQLRRIDAALARRGKPVIKPPV